MKNIGLIGAGMIGDVHIKNLRLDGRGDVTHIAEKSEKVLAEKMDKWGITKGTTDYREMLEDKTLDAVIIGAPPYLHFQMVQDILAAGKHVLLEKPMAITPDDMQKTVELVAGHPNQIVLECTCRHARLQPKFTFIKSLIDSGAIGDVYHIHHNALSRGTFIEYNPDGYWAHQKKLAGGGPFFDWGVYDLSFHLGLLGDKPQLKSLRSFTKNGLKHYPQGFVSDIEEHGAAWLEFDNGMTYYYSRGNGVQAEIPNETRIFGTKGSLKFAFCSWDAPEIEHYYLEDGEEKHRTLTVEIPETHDDNAEMSKHFMDVLVDGAAPKMTVDLAAKHLNILFQILNNGQ